MVRASIFASNIGSEHLVGLAGSGATSGVAMAHYELHAWCLLVLGWVFVPFYMRSRVYTMPEFLERRFSPGARWTLSLISLVAYIVTKIAVGIFAGGVVFGTLIPDLSLTIGGATLDSFWIGSLAVVLLTGLYTIVGGMRAVACTEALRARGGGGHVGAGEGGHAHRLVLQRQLPVAGDALLRPDHRPLVLVAAGALVASLRNPRRIDLGYDSKGLSLVSLDLGARGLAEAGRPSPPRRLRGGESSCLNARPNVR